MITRWFESELIEFNFEKGMFVFLHFLRDWIEIEFYKEIFLFYGITKTIISDLIKKILLQYKCTYKLQHLKIRKI